jgi:hypothetical protein
VVTKQAMARVPLVGEEEEEEEEDDDVKEGKEALSQKGGEFK